MIVANTCGMCQVTTCEVSGNLAVVLNEFTEIVSSLLGRVSKEELLAIVSDCMEEEED